MSKDNTSQVNAALNAVNDQSEQDQVFYQSALKWCLYEDWSIEEAANLFSGCLPKREMLQPGEANAELDSKVLESENNIRRALYKPLKPVNNKRYFTPLTFSRKQLMEWAFAQKLSLPPLLVNAHRAQANSQRSGYMTPCLEAIQWTCTQFWKEVDFRHPPSQGEIVQALLQRFSDLDYEACIMVEYVCRHPDTRTPDKP
jgi:hypothetical protein